MYATIDNIVAWATTTDEPRPLILCEYAHAMGNSSGSLADYYSAFEQHHGLQGGFIWEWLDHGIRMQASDGTPYWVYGGDFGDEPNDGNFVADGMVWPDRTPHPGLLEFKYLARPVHVAAVDSQRGIFRVENRRFFSDLSDLRGEWSLKVEGATVQGGELVGFDTPPQSHSEVTLPIAWPEDQEAFVEFRFTAREETPWARAGDLVAWDQIPAPIGHRVAATAQPARRVQVVEDIGQLTLALGEQQAVFDPAAGELVRFGNRDLIVRGPFLGVWRAPTDNDIMQLRFGAKDRAVGLWQTLGLGQLERRLERMSVVAGEDGAQNVEIIHALTGRDRWDDVVHTHRYTLLEDGTLRIQSHVRFAADFADLPRIGLALQLSSDLKDLAWYGRGPLDNYSDRKASSMVDVYRSTVTAQYVPYIVPQEHGHKTDVRWLRLTNQDRYGLEVTSDAVFEFNALHYTDEDLTSAQHTPELMPRPDVLLHLDHGMRGLGTGLGMDTLPKYRLNASEYRFTFDLKLI
jgi:beta-galactosidase